MKISGFTFIHNYTSGYPIREAIESVKPFVDEIVVVDMQSTDNTREILKSLAARIIEGIWDCKAGETLARAHAQHTECKHDIIWHFEADEIFDFNLASKIQMEIKYNNRQNISVERIQVEQNFQKVRWYPHYVHRIFPKGSVLKVGETTDKKYCEDMLYLDGSYGYLWDCTNCFRDQWLSRIMKQSELRDWEPFNLLYAAEHINLSHRLSFNETDNYLNDEIWLRKYTPLKIPEILSPLVGKTCYE